MFGLLEFLLLFCNVDYCIKLSDKKMMPQIGNNRDLAYLFISLWTFMKGVLFTSLLFCTLHPHPFLNSVII